MIRLFKLSLPNAAFRLAPLDCGLLTQYPQLRSKLFYAMIIPMGLLVFFRILPGGVFGTAGSQQMRADAGKRENALRDAKSHSPFPDLLILLQTRRVALWNEGAR